MSKYYWQEQEETIYCPWILTTSSQSLLCNFSWIFVLQLFYQAFNLFFAKLLNKAMHKTRDSSKSWAHALHAGGQGSIPSITCLSPSITGFEPSTINKTKKIKMGSGRQPWDGTLQVQDPLSVPQKGELANTQQTQKYWQGKSDWSLDKMLTRRQHVSKNPSNRHDTIQCKR